MGICATNPPGGIYGIAKNGLFPMGIGKSGGATYFGGDLGTESGDVAMLDRECEMARQKALAPVREQRTQACIEQQMRTPESCRSYYKTYGNVRRGPSGAPVGGSFFDLPPCQAWLRAREDLRSRNSQP